MFESDKKNRDTFFGRIAADILNRRRERGERLPGGTVTNDKGEEIDFSYENKKESDRSDSEVPVEDS